MNGNLGSNLTTHFGCSLDSGLRRYLGDTYNFDFRGDIDFSLIIALVINLRDKLAINLLTKTVSS